MKSILVTFVFNKTARKQNGVRNGHKHKSEDEIIKVENGMPVIILKDLWLKVQKNMNGRKQAKGVNKAKEIYLLSELVFCGSCNSAMVGNRKTAGRDKMIYTSYECSGRKRHQNCRMKSVGKNYLENQILDYLLENIFLPEGIESITNKLVEHSKKNTQEIPTEIRKYTKELNEIQKQIGNTVNAIANGMFHPSMKEKMDDLEMRKNGLVIKIEEAKFQLSKNTLPSKEVIKAYLSKDTDIKEKSPDEQKSIIQTYVQKVILKDDLSCNDSTIEIHSIVDFIGGGGALHIISTIFMKGYRHRLN